MKKALNYIGKNVFIAIAVIVGFAAVITVAFLCSPECTTLAEREARINNIKSGFVIASETEVDRHIISAAYSGDQTCLTVFEPEGKGYKLATNAYRPIDDILILSAPINGINYDFCWYNGKNITSAQVTYTDAGGKQASSVYDVEDNSIVVSESPDGDYTVNVSYTDTDGNIFE